MKFCSIRLVSFVSVAVMMLAGAVWSPAVHAQSSSSNNSGSNGSGSNSSGSGSSSKGQNSSSSTQQGPPQEKAPSLIDPAGPTVSLISSEQVFLMAAALNACGYDEGLDESEPIRERIREEINQALAKSEDARNKRDKICLYIAQHRITGGERDISQYISLALYLTPPPERR